MEETTVTRSTRGGTTVVDRGGMSAWGILVLILAVAFLLWLLSTAFARNPLTPVPPGITLVPTSTNSPDTETPTDTPTETPTETATPSLTPTPTATTL